MSEAALSFAIDAEVAPAGLEDLLNFIYQQYLLPRPQNFTNIQRTMVDHEHVLAFTFLEPKRRWYIGVEMRTGRPIWVKMTPSDQTVPQSALSQIKEDLIIGVQFYEEQMRKTTLYFAFVEGEEVVPEKTLRKRKNVLRSLFFESMILLFILFMIGSIFLFFIFGSLTPVLLVVFQFLIVLNADKVISRMGDWILSPQKPRIHLLQYHLSLEEYEKFRQKYRLEELLQMKKEIYDRTLALGKDINCETSREVLLKHGFECVPENMATKTVDVYQLVKNAAEIYGLPIPKIVISNTMLPNAAASGPSPRRGVILITTGLLVQLEEDEILSVMGHEFGHLKGKDPLILSALTSSEYLFRVYVLWYLWPALFFFPFFYFYFLFITGGIYFIAKFFEARADLESAAHIGQPQVLAEALRKIGFRRLQLERVQANKVQEWLGYDPHPPIYFRIGRLERLQTPVKVRHTLVQSIKDVVNGFLAVLK